MQSLTVSYFGTDTVSQAIAAYFAVHGVTEEVRDRLMSWERKDPESFFDMVSEFVERSQASV